MALVPYIVVLSAAFLMGFASAAPMGPVNMLAIRRGSGEAELVCGAWRSGSLLTSPVSLFSSTPSIG
jgi:hypothetical protein